MEPLTIGGRGLKRARGAHMVRGLLPKVSLTRL